MKLSTSGIAGLQNSMRESFYRNHTIPQQIPTTISAFNSRTIMIGQNGEARAVVTCVNILHSLTPGKAIMEVDFAGRKAVAKYWPAEFQERLVCLITKNLVIEALTALFIVKL